MRYSPYGWSALAVAALACSSNAPRTGSTATGSGEETGASGDGTGSGSVAQGTGGSGSGGLSSTGSSTGNSGTTVAGSGSGSGSGGVSGMGSSGGGSGGSSSGSGGSSATPDGGDDASSDSASAGEGGAGCASGYQLCDDFEGVAAGATGSVWTIDNSGYTVETVTTMAHSGTHSVHVAAKGVSGHGYIVETKTFPATDFWGRAYLLLQAPGSGHEVFVALDGNNNEQVRILNDLGNGKIATNRRSDDQSKESSQAYPMGTWACYEWHETPTGLHVYFQGSELTDIAETWTEATFSLLRLGFERFDTGTGGDIYIDDVAVNNEQIGCD